MAGEAERATVWEDHELPPDLTHPANERAVGFLKAMYGEALPDAEISRSPESFSQPNYNIGTHPDIIERLWLRITAELPEDCRWVICHRPTLVHPSAGIIFGFATGTSTYGLRLPQTELAEALAAGAKRQYVYPGHAALDLEEVGDGWVFGAWFKDEPRWCLAAYHHAKELRDR